MADACWDQSSFPGTTRAELSKNPLKELYRQNEEKAFYSVTLWTIHQVLAAYEIFHCSSSLLLQSALEAQRWGGRAAHSECWGFCAFPSKLICQGAAQLALPHPPWVELSSRWMVTHVREAFCNQLGAKMSHELFIQSINSESTVCAWLPSLTWTTAAWMGQIWRLCKSY